MKYLYLLFLLSLSCSTNTKNDKADLDENPTQQIQPNQLVLIFDGCPDNSFHTFSNGVYTRNQALYQVRYIDDQGIVRPLAPKLKPERDTLVIHTEQKVVEVQHAYLALDNLSYLFQNGDTVLFTYDGQKPIATILNREFKPDEVNYDLIKREYLIEGSFPGLIRVQPIFALVDSTFNHLKLGKEKFDAVEEAGKEAAVLEYRKELRWLDSLHQRQMLSDKSYNFYKEKAIYNIAQLHIPIARLYENDKPNRGVHLYSLEGKNEIPKIEDLLKSGSDSLINSFFYQDLLNKVLYDFIMPKADRIISSSSNLPDYKQVYDSIAIAGFLDDNQKKHLLFKTIGHIIENSSLAESQQYWSKFKSDVPDTAFTHYIEKKYELGKAVSDELQLKTLEKKEITFDEILLQNKGKVIYVDFWATWCAPCIKALPDSHALQNEFKDRDIVFVYFSIDDSIEQWVKGAEKHNLQNKSYWIANRRTSRMLDELSVQSIPRYLIFDKNGLLAHRNAPGPKGMEIRKFLDKYLSEDVYK